MNNKVLIQTFSNKISNCFSILTILSDRSRLIFRFWATYLSTSLEWTTILFSRVWTFVMSQNKVLLSHEASNFKALTDTASAALSTLNKYFQSFCIEFATELSFSEFNKFSINKWWFRRDSFKKWKTFKTHLQTRKPKKSYSSCFLLLLLPCLLLFRQKYRFQYLHSFHFP